MANFFLYNSLTEKQCESDGTDTLIKTTEENRKWTKKKPNVQKSIMMFLSGLKLVSFYQFSAAIILINNTDSDVKQRIIERTGQMW